MTEGKILTNEDICLLLEWKINKESAVPSWVMPNGKIVPTPPLTTSLDIQEKYVWPWLEKEYGADFEEITFIRDLEDFWICYITILDTPENRIVSGNNKDPATAFNLALSELANTLEKKP